MEAEGVRMSDSPPDLNPIPPVPRGDPDFPDLRDFGGVSRVRREMRRSATIMANREAIAWHMLAMGSTVITDVVGWNEAGELKFVPSSKVDPRHIGMVKSIEQRLDKAGNVVGIKLTLYDRVAVLRLLAGAAGLLRKDADDDKPAVMGVRVRGPKRKTVTVEQEKE
jgi:hypothetical protein